MSEKQTHQEAPADEEQPRVEPTYRLQLYGKEVTIALPFVVGVMADLSGHAAGTRPPVEERQFVEIDADSFDERLKEVRPRLAIIVPHRLAGQGEMAVELAFECLGDFSPEGVARQVEPIAGRTGDTSDEARRAVCEQLNLILHHDDFRRLEGVWRGLHYLVSRTETDELLKIRVLNVSKAELARMRERFPGERWRQSPAFQQAYEQTYGRPGGEPFAVFVGDYYFDHTPADVDLLAGLADIAAAAHAPLIAGAGPALLNMASWQELPDRAEPAISLEGPDFAAWHALRSSDNSRYLALTVPRMLARAAYVPDASAPGKPAFTEDTAGGDHRKHVWSNAAYAMAANIARAWKSWGWPARIRGVESGGMVEDLPASTFTTDDGQVDMRCPTEVALTELSEAELAKQGLLPLSHWKDTSYCVFIGAQSLNQPAEHDDEDSSLNAMLAARLPYLLPACRFAHYLMCITRDKIGSFSAPEQVEAYLNAWLADYVQTDAEAGSEHQEARRPLAVGQVRIGQEFKGTDGCCYCAVDFVLLPSFQLAGLRTPLRLGSILPAARPR